MALSVELPDAVKELNLLYKYCQTYSFAKKYLLRVETVSCLSCMPQSDSKNASISLFELEICQNAKLHLSTQQRFI